LVSPKRVVLNVLDIQIFRDSKHTTTATEKLKILYKELE
jgi:hypothetical protein